MSSDDAGIVFQEDSITIQHDWQRSLETEKDKFFVNFKKYGEKTISYDVQCEKGKLKEEMDATGNVKAEVDGTSIKLVLGNVSKKFIAPFREFRNLHKTSINSIDISQTENLMVSSDSSSELFVHDAKIGKRLRELEGHIYDVYSCKFFPSGLIVLSGGMDMTVRIYSVEDGWNARTMKGHKAAVHDLGIIGEGVDVASCSRDGTCKIWNCASGNFTQDIQPEIGQLHGLALSDTDLHFIGLGGESNKAVIYDLRSNEKCFDFDVDSSCSTVVFDSGMHFYAGTSQGTLYSFDLRNKNPETIVKTQRGNVHKLKFNGIFGILASFHDGTVAAFKLVLENGKSYLEFTGSDCDPVYDLSISGNSLVTACRDKAIRKYNLDGIKIDS